MQVNRNGRFVIALLVTICVTTGALGQGVGSKTYNDHYKYKLVELTVSAAKPPDLVIRYALLPQAHELKNGNAALAYGKALNWMRDSRDKIEFGELLKLPIDQLKTAKIKVDERELTVKQFLDEQQQLLKMLHDAARLRQCDWGHDLSQGLTMLLPNLSPIRQVSRIVALAARWEIARGNYQGALEYLRTGIGMARHLEQGVTLIESLVGIAIGSMMMEQVETFMQQPDAPNLYWSLVELPSPMVSMQKGLMHERDMIYLWMPSLKDAWGKTLTVESGRMLLDKISNEFTPTMLMGGPGDAQQAQGIVTALAVVNYPRYKRELIQQGHDPVEVEKMPVAQVVITQMLADYDRARGDIFKWFSLPYWQARQVIKEEKTILIKLKLEGNPLAILLPAISRANTVQWRLDRKVKALQVIEAVRDYAANHDRHLPKSLADITNLPLPVDPMTGQSFLYRVEGNVFYVEGKKLSELGARTQLGYKITLRK